MTELELCDEQIREHEANLRSGHKDVAGLYSALLDWRTERRLLMCRTDNGTTRNNSED